MLDKEIHLISCKQYLINNMQVMDLDAMGIHGTILDEWLLDISRLPNLHNQSYASVHRSSYAFFFAFDFLFVMP